MEAIAGSIDAATFVSVAPLAGHGASTLNLLRSAGINDLDTGTYRISGCADFTMGEDSRLSFASNPAGTARIEIAYQSINA